LALANLVIAGIGKSGTTSLFRYLTQHPDICGSSVKETGYFSPLRFGHPLAPISEYARYFAHCNGERYLLEATSAYCYGGAEIVAAMQATLQDPRVLICLREPGERLWDNFWFMKSKRHLDADLGFDEYLATCLALRAQGRDVREEHRFYRLSTSYYEEYLWDWIDGFGPHLRFVDFERLIADPMLTVRDVCAWLELDTGPVGSFDFDHHNRTVQAKSPLVQQMAVAVNATAGTFLSHRPRLKQRLRDLYLEVNGAPLELAMPATTRQQLDELFAASKARLADLLVRHGHLPLPTWLQAVGTSR
jgi:hypothetical protein